MQTELFQPHQYLNPKWYYFKKTTLGEIHGCIPWDQLADCLPEDDRGPGAPRWFDNRGMFALMFLKSYLDLSDEKLIRQFNTDVSLQFFCGKVLRSDEHILDKDIVGRIRGYIAENADWQEVQSVLINHWKRDMNNIWVLFMPACRRQGCYLL